MGSISRHFLTRVVVPAGCLVLLWGLLAGTAIAGPLTKLRWLADRPAPQQTRIELAMVAGAGLAVIVVAVLLMNALSRRVARGSRATSWLMAGICPRSTIPSGRKRLCC